MPPKEALAPTLHPALHSYAAPTLQSLQPGLAASSAQERISGYLRTSARAGDLRALPVSQQLTAHTSAALGLDVNARGGPYAPSSSPSFYPTPEASVARVLGTARVGHVDFSPQQQQQQQQQSGGLIGASRGGYAAAMQGARTSSVLGVPAGTGGVESARVGGSTASTAAAAAIEAARSQFAAKQQQQQPQPAAASVTTRPPVNAWASRMAGASSTALTTTAAAAPLPAPTSAAASYALPTNSSFSVPGREALEAATRHNMELFNALLKNASSLGVGNGEWVTAYAQQLEAGVLGQAHAPPRDLLASAALSLGLTKVLESLEFVHASVLAMDLRVVEDAQRGAALQLEAEQRTAAARDPHTWWKMATERGAAGGGVLSASAQLQLQLLLPLHEAAAPPPPCPSTPPLAAPWPTAFPPSQRPQWMTSPSASSLP